MPNTSSTPTITPSPTPPIVSVPGELNIDDVVGKNKGFINFGDPGTVLNTISHYILFVGFSIVTLIAVALVINAGFKYMTAGDKSDKIEEASDSLKKALIGLVIILLSFVFVGLVLGFFGLTNDFVGFNIFDFKDLFSKF